MEDPKIRGAQRVRRIAFKFASICLCAFFSATSFAKAAEIDAAQKKLTYSISRNGDPIGTYRFDIIDKADGSRAVTANMDVTVKKLLITVYSMKHQRHDLWQRDSLVRSEGETEYSGKRKKIVVSRENGVPRPSINGENQNVKPPLITFVPWLDKNSLAGSLLTEKGNVREVRRESEGKAVVTVKGARIGLNQYIYKGPWERRAWYDNAGWLRLMEYEKDGAKLRIELITGLD